MINSNYCVGCCFAGTVDGYEPECNCCCKKDAAIIASIENNEVAVNMFDHVDELLPDTKQCDTTHQDKKKARRMQRRIAAKKYARKAPERLAITNAKLDRLPVSASSDDFAVANKKCFNAEKKAICAYQTTIFIEFAELPKNFKFAKSLYSLIFRISSLAEPSDIEVLQTAISNDGQLVGLHREGNVLQIKIGFRDKVSMSDFIHKTAS